MSSKNRTIYKAYIRKLMWPQHVSLPFGWKKWSVRSISFKTVNALLLLSVIMMPLFASISVSNLQPLPSMVTKTLAAELPTVSITYTSRWNSTPTVLNSGARISGDHIVIAASWTPVDNMNGSMLVVSAPAIPQVLSASSPDPAVSIDTRALGNNATCSVNATTWLLNGTRISYVLTNIFIGNFFVPHVTLIYPNGGHDWAAVYNVTWVASDLNSDDSLVFDVLVSADDGMTFQLLASDLNRTWFLWDSTDFLNLSTYVFQVRAFDGIYWASDQSDLPFAAGGVNETSTTTGTSTTTPYTNDQVVGYFIAAAIISSAILSLIVYYIARKEFKFH